VLVAEELAMPPGSVRVVMGNTDVSPFDFGTFGSRAMPFAAPPLRAAAAAAREVLREAAAERFGLPAADLTVAGGIVAGPDGAPSVDFADLLAGVRRVERVPADRPVTSPAAWRTAGRPARAAGGGDVVTGVKRFPADLRADGMQHGCLLRPPAFGATLRSADTARAKALPGVSVVREDDFIAVLAPTAVAARQAVNAIDAVWDRAPQPGRDELASYLRSHPVDGESGPNAPFRHEQGDVDAALAAGAVRRAETYTTAYIAHVPLEPRSALATWQGGHLTVWTGTSTPFRARRELAQAFGVPEQQVHVIVPDYGGGFGGKHGSAVAAEAARLARAAGQGPVEPPRGVSLELPASRGAHRRREQHGPVREDQRLVVRQHPLRAGRDPDPVRHPPPAHRLPAGRLAAAAGLVPGAGRHGEPLRPGVSHGRAGPRHRRRPAGVPAAPSGRRPARRRVPRGRGPDRLAGPGPERRRDRDRRRFREGRAGRHGGRGQGGRRRHAAR
jgi:CO/xanthine dehydrogenase Mo-binding subunit